MEYYLGGERDFTEKASAVISMVAKPHTICFLNKCDIYYSSICGYDHNERQKHTERHVNNSTKHIKQKDKWTRRVAYNFTECLAHVEITEDISTGRILRIAGIVEHNRACQESTMTRIPYIPLHSHVYEVALQQLHAGARYVILLSFRQFLILLLLKSCYYT